MVLDAESVIERRRLKRRVTIWRIAAVVLGLLFVGAILFSQQMVGPGSILPHVARISIAGVITDDRKMIELIDKVAKSDQVKAVILDINSPGGTTTGGEAMYDAIRRLTEKKPVVATCGTLATSAAYIVRSPPTASSSTATPSPGPSASSSNGPTSPSCSTQSASRLKR